MVAKLVELLRRHRLENVDLLFEQPLNRMNAAKVLGTREQIVAIEREHRRVELVQKLLEPQLVDLMDDDEEHLVVMRRVGERLLKAEQLVNFQVGTVGKRHSSRLTGGAEVLLESAACEAFMSRRVRRRCPADGVFERTTARQRARRHGDESDRVSALRRCAGPVGARMAHDDLRASGSRRQRRPRARSRHLRRSRRRRRERKRSCRCSNRGWRSERESAGRLSARRAAETASTRCARTRASSASISSPLRERRAGKRHGVVVMVVDPQTLDEKAGPMLGLIGRFKHMPRMLRDPIDAQAKKQTGFSITEATNPDTPIGAAVAALDELRDFGGRGIVLIDAVKQ